MDIRNGITELIGKTPIVRLGKLLEQEGIEAEVIVKLEYFNPGGSVKDRVAAAMILDAQQSGRLQLGGTIIEPTSGNTGVGLAMVAAAMGYKMVLTMPETMSFERKAILRALGAELILTDGKAGMSGAIAKAEELLSEIPGSITMGQFVNPANPRVHELTTGPEILEQTAGTIDIFVAGVGTGGTISGVGRALKRANPNIQIVGVEPLESAVLSGASANPHKIQGIGAGFVPQTYDASVVDEIITIAGDEAIRMGRVLARTEGLLVGISSGAAVAGACVLARREENRGKRIVALLPDTGERYLSTALYAFEEYPL